MATSTKARKEGKRRVWLVSVPDREKRRVGTLETVKDGKAEWYWLAELDTPLGRGFRLTKWSDGAGYDVLLALDGRHTCDCAGHSYRGRCKHVDGLAALVMAGRL
jgi:hypothetical protein